jgi:HEAT repeat protein
MTQLETEGDTQALVAALADAARRGAAFEALVGLGPRARAAVRAGLGDGRWEVRRWCVYWLLRFPDAGDAAALAPLARDPRSRVRHAALVALVKAPGAAASEELHALLLERALGDESLHVRRHAVLALAWHLPHRDLEGFFAELLRTERDAKLRKFAALGLLRSRARAAAPASGTPSC